MYLRKHESRKSKIRLGWSVAMRSIHEGFLLGSKFVGSEMILKEAPVK